MEIIIKGEADDIAALVLRYKSGGRKMWRKKWARSFPRNCTRGSRINWKRPGLRKNRSNNAGYCGGLILCKLGNNFYKRFLSVPLTGKDGVKRFTYAVMFNRHNSFNDFIVFGSRQQNPPFCYGF